MENITPPRDLGHNNAVKRPHLNLKENNIYEILSKNDDEEIIDILQKVVNKIEYKLNRCERFLLRNKDEILLSYYTEGYYNGRARAFEDMLDYIKDTLNEE